MAALQIFRRRERYLWHQAPHSTSTGHPIQQSTTYLPLVGGEVMVLYGDSAIIAYSATSQNMQYSTIKPRAQSRNCHHLQLKSQAVVMDVHVEYQSQHCTTILFTKKIQLRLTPDDTTIRYNVIKELRFQHQTLQYSGRWRSFGPQKTVRVQCSALKYSA